MLIDLQTSPSPKLHVQPSNQFATEQHEANEEHYDSSPRRHPNESDLVDTPPVARLPKRRLRPQAQAPASYAMQDNSGDEEDTEHETEEPRRKKQRSSRDIDHDGDAHPLTATTIDPLAIRITNFKNAFLLAQVDKSTRAAIDGFKVDLRTNPPAITVLAAVRLIAGNIESIEN
jgi:hypothetical protein